MIININKGSLLLPFFGLFLYKYPVFHSTYLRYVSEIMQTQENYLQVLMNLHEAMCLF